MSDAPAYFSVPGAWANSDEFAATMVGDLRLQTVKSTTMDQDKSQPPTPDGSGNPTNFGTIAPGLYRSSYPQWAHFQKLADLELKTVITLVPEPLSLDYANFLTSNGIVHHHIPILANKDPSVFTSVSTVHEILNLMLDPDNYPILIHCNKGRHRTGCMAACFRKVTGYTDDKAIAEYVHYSHPKPRDLDKEFIRRFDSSALKSLALERRLYGEKKWTGSSRGRRSEDSMSTSERTILDSVEEVQAILDRFSKNDELVAAQRLWVSNR